MKEELENNVEMQTYCDTMIPTSDFARLFFGVFMAKGSKNHLSGAGHVNAHPYPDKGISGADKPGPSAEKGGITKSISGASKGVSGSMPKGLKC